MLLHTAIVSSKFGLCASLAAPTLGEAQYPLTKKRLKRGQDAGSPVEADAFARMFTIGVLLGVWLLPTLCSIVEAVTSLLLKAETHADSRSTEDHNRAQNNRPSTRGKQPGNNSENYELLRSVVTVRVCRE